MIQAGIEGFVKTRQPRGAAKFIQNEFNKQMEEFEEHDDIAWWAQLAQHQITTFIDLYGKDLDRFQIKEAEVKTNVELTLPSGRTILMKGYLDGEGPDIIMENKCRGKWAATEIAREIDLNLQVNYYLLLYKAKTGKLPRRVWYQHIRRPGGYGYSGPRKKSKESDDAFRKRLAAAIDSDRPYHFFRYMMLPNEERFNRFTHACLYPMLEAFLDWYGFMCSPKGSLVNSHHWLTPYGLYNPFTEETAERYRTWRMTGSTIGLRPKVFTNR